MSVNITNDCVAAYFSLIAATKLAIGYVINWEILGTWFVQLSLIMPVMSSLLGDIEP